MQKSCPMNSRPHTQALFEKLTALIPGGVNSPVRACKDVASLPLIVDAGLGSTITDVDGNQYIDYCCSWGTLLHGHAHPKIVKVVQERVAKGSSFGITTPEEEALARKITEHLPSMERIRFVSSGTEATMSAVRVARGFTGRNGVIKFIGNYHGHADQFLVQAGSGMLHTTPTASSAGVPEDMVKQTINIPYNDVESLITALKGMEIAAVIVEPIAANMGVVLPTPEFLKALREETEKVGTLLIFDEVITGFRVGLKGAQGLFGIKPDLTCLGKIIGGGFPAAAFGGRADVMRSLAPEGPVYQAGTLSGNPVAMAAGLEAIKLAETPGFYTALEAKTNILVEPLRKRFPGCVQQMGSMFTPFFGVKKVSNLDEAKLLDQEAFKNLFHWLLDRGIYIPPSPYEAWFVSAAHTEAQLKKTGDAIHSFLV